jgi:glucose/arabinose dehydrogenase
MTDRPVPRRSTLIVSLVALLIALVVPLTSARGATPNVTLTQVTSGLQSLTQVTNAGDGTGRLFLVERRGTIRVVQNGAVRPGFFMDIRGIVDHETGGERGLLGLAFHPNFETNRRLFVYYTRNGGDIIVARYTTNVARTAVVHSTGRNVLVIEHSARTNHNGGAMAFGPDGYLYLGTGDGGGSGDPDRNGQSKTKNLLAKILRININGTGAGTYGRYSIPPTNPFRGSIAGRDEVWAYGLRNPWRISFDRLTGALFIADVGQNRYEEINREPAGYRGGRNYGWSVMEGKHCFRTSGCSLAGDTLPVAEYTHASGNCSITGGYVYRGPAVPLRNWYVFADFCSGRIWTMAAAGSTLFLRRDTTWNITSFGEGEDGTLYLVTIDGRLVRVGAT